MKLAFPCRLIALGFSVIAILVETVAVEKRSLGVGLAVIAYVLSYSLIIKRCAERVSEGSGSSLDRLVVKGQFYLDLSAVLAVQYLTGGAESIIFVLLFPLTLFAGLYLTLRELFAFSTTSCLSLAALFILEYLGLLPHMPRIPGSQLHRSLPLISSRLILIGVAFLMTSAASILLSRLLDEREDKLKALYLIGMLTSEAATPEDYIRRAVDRLNGLSGLVVELRERPSERSFELRVKDELFGIISFAGRLARDERFIKTLVRSLNLGLERVTLYKRMFEEAISDPLTGLYNRRLMERRMEEMMEIAGRSGERFAVVFIDIDNFKRFNDTYGHSKGDEVLRAIGDLIRENIRKSDLPCRYGGDEFVILLPYADRRNAEMVAMRISRGFDRLGYGELSLSFGTSSFPEDGNSVAELIEAADARMYEMKRGKGLRTC